MLQTMDWFLTVDSVLYRQVRIQVQEGGNRFPTPGLVHQHCSNHHTKLIPDLRTDIIKDLKHLQTSFDYAKCPHFSSICFHNINILGFSIQILFLFVYGCIWIFSPTILLFVLFFPKFPNFLSKLSTR